jgi:MYXO-CTERM domain-containing protein
MRTRSIARARRAAAAALLGSTLAGAALAVPIPAAHFTYDVSQGGKVLVDCTSLGGSSTGGTCGSETSGPGYAATSGGIGTPSYLPVTPGGTMLGTGTAVDSLSTWTSGGLIFSNAKMTYSFEATGPASVPYIPIDIISTGLLSSSGDGAAYLSLVVQDSGTDANIPPGVPDPELKGPSIDLTAVCVAGFCQTDWYTADHEVTDLLCVVNGDNYTVTIDAITLAGPGRGADNSASAVLDPKILLDPPYPTQCPVAVSLNELGVDAGPGASTGYIEAAVPEPSGFTLAAMGLFGLGALGLRRRLKAASRPC